MVPNNIAIGATFSNLYKIVQNSDLYKIVQISDLYKIARISDLYNLVQIVSSNIYIYIKPLW